MRSLHILLPSLHIMLRSLQSTIFLKIILDIYSKNKLVSPNDQILRIWCKIDMPAVEIMAGVVVIYFSRS